MFSGRAEASLDDKGRIAVPTMFRADLLADADGHLVVTSHPLKDCLVLYVPSQWNEVKAQLSEMSTFKDGVWTMIQSATDIKMDKQGRMLVPSVLREEAGLRDKMVLGGVLDYIELWDAAAHRMELARAKENTRKTVDEGQTSGVPGLPF